MREPLRKLAERDIFIGTSSWKYPGWMGQIYTPERYQVRGRFSKATFEKNCLAEYAETFPTVCGDFTFYQFPSPEMLDALFAQVPPSFQMSFKATEETTVRIYPHHPRYGDRGGKRNPAFLDPFYFAAMFLAPMEKYRERVAIIFEFGSFSKDDYAEPAEFCIELSDFLGALPDGWRYAVEIRNEDYLTPEYLSLLREHGVAHVLNGWARMPDLQEQLDRPGVMTADFTVVRALLRKGRPYEQAVKTFSPYTEIKDPNPRGRKAIQQVIEQAFKERRSVYAYVNNRYEGNAPATIAAILRAGA